MTKTILKGIFTEQAGNVLIICGLAMPLIIGFAGLATDTVQWSLDRREMQRTADSAALAGAYAIAQRKDGTASASESIVETNDIALESPPIIENAPTQGDFSGDSNAIFVQLDSRKALPFSSLFLSSGARITVRATAAVISNGDYCVISLDKGNDPGVEATGSSSVDLNCGIFANSRGSDAVEVGGSATIYTDVVGAVGGLSPSVNYASDVDLLPYSAPQPDPFADLPDPNPTNCSARLNVNPNQRRSVSPGCFRGMDIKGTIYFAPGIYYINGSSLSFGAQADVTADGVTFILTSTTASTNSGSIANLDINGGATLRLSPPDSGTYEGVLFYQDRRASSGTTKINGNASSVLEGSFYFPSHKLEFSGDSGMRTDCVQLVGSKIKFTGSSSISNVCPSRGARSFTGTVIRLVS